MFPQMSSSNKQEKTFPTGKDLKWEFPAIKAGKNIILDVKSLDIPHLEVFII